MNKHEVTMQGFLNVFPRDLEGVRYRVNWTDENGWLGADEICENGRVLYDTYSRNQSRRDAVITHTEYDEHMKLLEIYCTR